MSTPAWPSELIAAANVDAGSTVTADGDAGLRIGGDAAEIPVIDADAGGNISANADANLGVDVKVGAIGFVFNLIEQIINTQGSGYSGQSLRAYEESLAALIVVCLQWLSAVSPSSSWKVHYDIAPSQRLYELEKNGEIHCLQVLQRRSHLSLSWALNSRII